MTSCCSTHKMISNKINLRKGSIREVTSWCSTQKMISNKTNLRKGFIREVTSWCSTRKTLIWTLNTCSTGRVLNGSMNSRLVTIATGNCPTGIRLSHLVVSVRTTNKVINRFLFVVKCIGFISLSVLHHHFRCCANCFFHTTVNIWVQRFATIHRSYLFFILSRFYFHIQVL